MAGMFDKKVFAALCIAVCVSGVDVRAETGVLPVGATEWPPFQFTASDGKVVGADTELVEEVIRRMGYTPRTSIEPWTRTELRGRQGQLAGVFSVFKNPERERYFIYSDPINTSRTVFFKRAGNDLNYTVMGELAALRIATSAGYAYPEEFTAAVNAKTFRTIIQSYGARPEYDNLKMVVRDIADLAICEISVCQYLIATYPVELTGLDYTPRTIGTLEPLYFAISRKWPGAQELIREFNAALAKVVASGYRRALLEKYGMKSER